jgi:hypothetical protein
MMMEQHQNELIKENDIDSERGGGKELKPKEKITPIPKNIIQKYRSELQYYLLTTRFNNSTWRENRQYCEKTNKTCAYCTPCPISNNIPKESVLFILEMNNELNKIIGIGMLRNIPRKGNLVYGDGNYNRFSYIGKTRINRSEMDKTEEELMVLLDDKCFKGKGHLKRGQGLTLFPMSTLYRFENSKENPPIQIIPKIVEMFKKRK